MAGFSPTGDAVQPSREGRLIDLWRLKPASHGQRVFTIIILILKYFYGTVYPQLGYTRSIAMGASRLKPLTVKEVEKLTATKPSTIKHRYLGGVPGFVLVHTPAGHTSYGLIYRANGERKKLTLGNTKLLTLGET